MFSSLSVRSFLSRNVGRSDVLWNSSISNRSRSAVVRSFQASTACWEKLNLEGLAKKVDLDGKNVLVRVDLNVPLAKVRGCVFFSGVTFGRGGGGLGVPASPILMGPAVHLLVTLGWMISVQSQSARRAACSRPVRFSGVRVYIHGTDLTSPVLSCHSFPCRSVSVDLYEIASSLFSREFCPPQHQTINASPRAKYYPHPPSSGTSRPHRSRTT